LRKGLNAHITWCPEIIIQNSASSVYFLTWQNFSLSVENLICVLITRKAGIAYSFSETVHICWKVCKNVTFTPTARLYNTPDSIDPGTCFHQYSQVVILLNFKFQLQIWTKLFCYFTEFGLSLSVFSRSMKKKSKGEIQPSACYSWLLMITQTAWIQSRRQETWRLIWMQAFELPDKRSTTFEENRTIYIKISRRYI